MWNEKMYCSSVESPLGTLTLASDGDCLTGLWMEGQKHFGASFQLEACSDLQIFEEAKRWLESYFMGCQPSLTIPLRLIGTDFQRAVWQQLQRIPYGSVTTYGELAKSLNLSVKSSRAVGMAVGRNPISIIVPCHRVIGANGKLTGFAAGLERKRFLLQLESLTPFPSQISLTLDPSPNGEGSS